MVTHDAPRVVEYNSKVEALEIKNGGKKGNMIFGMGRGGFIFVVNRSDKIVVGEWR